MKMDIVIAGDLQQVENNEWMTFTNHFLIPNLRWKPRLFFASTKEYDMKNIDERFGKFVHAQSIGDADKGFETTMKEIDIHRIVSFVWIHSTCFLNQFPIPEPPISGTFLAAYQKTDNKFVVGSGRLMCEFLRFKNRCDIKTLLQKSGSYFIPLENILYIQSSKESTTWIHHGQSIWGTPQKITKKLPSILMLHHGPLNSLQDSILKNWQRNIVEPLQCDVMLYDTNWFDLPRLQGHLNPDKLVNCQMVSPQGMWDSVSNFEHRFLKMYDWILFPSLQPNKGECDPKMLESIKENQFVLLYKNGSILGSSREIRLLWESMNGQIEDKHKVKKIIQALELHLIEEDSPNKESIKSVVLESIDDFVKEEKLGQNRIDIIDCKSVIFQDIDVLKMMKRVISLMKTGGLMFLDPPTSNSGKIWKEVGCEFWDALLKTLDGVQLESKQEHRVCFRVTKKQ